MQAAGQIINHSQKLLEFVFHTIEPPHTEVDKPCHEYMQNYYKDIVFPPTMLQGTYSEPELSRRSRVNTAIEDAGGLESIIDALMTTPGPTDQLLMDTETIASVLSEDEQTQVTEILNKYLSNPHLIARHNGQYYPSPLAALLRLLPEESMANYKIAPDLCADLVRLLIRLCTHTEKPYPSSERLDSPCTTRFTRLLHRLMQQVDKTKLRELQKLVIDCPESLGPFAYGLSPENYEEFLYPIIDTLASHCRFEAAHSLAFLAPFSSCTNTIKHAFIAFMRTGDYSIRRAASLTNHVSIYDDKLDRTLAKELWDEYVTFVGLEFVFAQVYSQPELDFSPWQWESIFTHSSSVQHKEMLTSIRQELEIRCDVKAMLTGILQIESSLAKDLFVFWLAHCETNQEKALQTAAIVLLQNQESGLDIWNQFLEKSSEQNVELAAHVLMKIQRTEQLESTNSTPISRMYAVCFATLSDEKAASLAKNLGKNGSSIEAITGLLLAHQEPGLTYLYSFIKSENNGFISLSWQILFIFYHSLPEKYDELVQKILIHQRPTNAFYAAGIQPNINSQMLAPFFRGLSEEGFNQLSTFVWQRFALVHQDTKELPLPLRVTIIGSLLYTFFQAITPTQFATFLTVEDRCAELLPFLQRVALDWMTSPSSEECQKLYTLVQNLPVKMSYLPDVIRCLDLLREWNKDTVPHLAAHVQPEQTLTWKSPSDNLTLALLASHELRNHLFTVESIQSADPVLLLQVFPHVAMWLTPDQIGSVTKKLGLSTMARFVKQLTEEQRVPLRALYKAQASTPNLHHLGYLLGEKKLSATACPERGRINLQNTSCSIVMEAIPKQLQQSVAARAEYMRGEQGVIHIHVLRDKCNELGVYDQDLNALNLEWLTVHAVLFAPVADAFCNFHSMRAQEYKEHLKSRLSTYMQQKKLHTKEQLLDLLQTKAPKINEGEEAVATKESC